jgi:6-pyruvoyltetrahydropterin/6-carboxytetrahydropterin synthase
MYTVTVVRPLIAQHFLTVPDPGPEGDLHSHHFRVEVELAGGTLNEYDYLVDIDEVNDALDAVERRYADETLNSLPKFEGYNPSVERFARVVHERDRPRRVAWWSNVTSRARGKRARRAVVRSPTTPWPNTATREPIRGRPSMTRLTAVSTMARSTASSSSTSGGRRMSVSGAIQKWLA